MRLAAVEVRNYKGIARAKIDGLESEPIVIVSGRNGTGKSLLLEAIVGVWSGRYSMQSRVGPWGDELAIDLHVAFSAAEMEIIADWHQRIMGSACERKPTYNLRHIASAVRKGRSDHVDNVIHVVRNSAFQRENPFSIIDFLPATRLVPSAPTTKVDLAMLNLDRVEEERVNMLDKFINNKAPANLPNVSSYLVTLDYQALLAERQGLQVPNEYQRLAHAFNEATTKTLLEPQYDPARGSNIDVELLSGHRHGLGDLSSGEQEMLALLYFVRRLSAAGGILCLDEPEQHLHPTLQAALFEGMRDVAERAQVVVVSHSVNLIAAAPISGLVQVSAPSDAETNQVSRLRDEPSRSQLVAELGITPAHLLQSDLLLVVEGDTDAQWLRAMFPVELGRAHLLIAGSATQVVSAHDTLEKAPPGIPWLCLRDRDLATAAEVDQLKQGRDHLYIWDRRAMESNFLNAELLSAVLTSLGRTVSVEEATSMLDAAVDPLKDEVLAELVKKELSRRHPAPTVGVEGNRLTKMEEHLRKYASINSARGSAARRCAGSENWSGVAVANRLADPS